MKKFNTTAICIPEKHYMVDISEKLKQITELIEDNSYFTINRSRQYGKTTTLFLLEKSLQKKYDVISISFEGAGSIAFSSDENFVFFLIRSIYKTFAYSGISDELAEKWINTEDFQTKLHQDAFEYLDDKISWLCRNNQKEILLFIDEVDKASDNQIFLNFLGMLRNKYLEYQRGKGATFKSVILGGVYDVKNLKLKIRPDIEKKYNSPWNIAADFNVDMSFQPKEIETMLTDYEGDHHTGMDIEEISKELYFYTKGYPYLVSWLCKWIDEQGNKIWTKENIRNSQKALLNSNNSTLLDDVIKNIENYSELANVVERIIYKGESFAYNNSYPEIQKGIMFGILCERDHVLTVSNIIFETFLYNYFSIKAQIKNGGFQIAKNQFVEDGKLNMQKVLTKFQEIMRAEYRVEDGKFLEQQGRLLFLCFLKPIINGVGFYYVEPETRNSTRMDIVVAYGGEEHIIELKLWKGDQYRRDGIKQLEQYMDSRNSKIGYLMSFSFNKNKEYKNCFIGEEETDKEIFEVVV